jgi:NAD(P)-dependent dehydrogenase (short-subunit alcohol dehydrogenase family)
MAGGFGATTTTDEVLDAIDLTGKRYLVTGVSAGLGVETARALVAHGASVIGAARDLAKAEAATAEIGAAAGPGSFDLIELDLASLASVRAAADRLLADGRRFDAVIANAGIMATPEGRTADGFELQFGTNHLGHFLFVNQIAPLIVDGGRFVSLSSGAHHFSDIDIADPNFETMPYDPWLAYGAAKTANALFAVEFDRRHRARGIRAASVHPGGINTELGRYMSEEAQATLAAAIAEMQASGQGFAFKSVPQGAATSVWAATVADPAEIGGRYLEDCHVAETVEAQSVGFGVRSYALDAERAKLLWDKSEELVGERF